MSTYELIDAIDANNNVIGQVTKAESYKRRISHRIVHVMVCCANKVFIPRRSLRVGYLPGHYCSSAGGHVRSGETPEEGALRELKEEIGLDGPIHFVQESFFTHEFKVHSTLFIKRFDPLTERMKLNEEEVLSGEFYSLDEFARLDQTRFHPQLASCVAEIGRFL